jgi:hypothetical protein
MALSKQSIESKGFLYEKTMSLGPLRTSYWTGNDKVVGRILHKKTGKTMCWHMALHDFGEGHIKIEAQMSDAETYTFFEGMIHEEKELSTVLKMIGYETT